MAQNSKKHILIVLSLIFIVSCSAFNTDKQFTKKITAPAFVSELYGNNSLTLSINHNEASHITWMGFIQSNNYKYFKITKATLGSETIVADGVETDGELYTANSNSLLEDINVGFSESEGTGFTNGTITVSGSGDFKVTVQYSPLLANKSLEFEDGSLEAVPHEAYLIIYYDKPDIGAMRIKLEGYTQGIKSEKCTQAVSTMEVIEYKVVNSAFDLYFCSGEVAKVNQNNTTQDSSDAAYHGASTNINSIPLTDDVITFYKVDDETVCLLTDPTPSVPGFTLPIPEGLAPIDSMDIALMEGSFAECSLDSDGNILCDENILIDALVAVSDFSLNNTGFTADELTTNDCPDFGAISGSGAFGDDAITLILTGRTLSDQNTEEFNIVDSLIVAEIALEK